MREGQIRIPANRLLGMLGYEHLKLEDMTVNLFANVVVIKVSGACEIYPETVEPIPDFKAVIGLEDSL